MKQFEGKKAKNRSWAFAGFGKLKKNKKINIVIDFNSICDYLNWTEYPLATMDDIPDQIFRFSYASNLDLNMGYLSMPLDYKTRKILMPVTTFGLYECLVLPQGISLQLTFFNDDGSVYLWV